MKIGQIFNLIFLSLNVCFLYLNLERSQILSAFSNNDYEEELICDLEYCEGDSVEDYEGEYGDPLDAVVAEDAALAFPDELIEDPIDELDTLDYEDLPAEEEPL